MDRKRKAMGSRGTPAMRIVAERRVVQARLAALERPGSPSIWADSADNTPAAEVVDVAQDSVARDLVFASRAVLLSRLKALARAEAKLCEGSYGRCERCQQPIPVGRLRALPEAVHCVSCAEDMAGAA